MAPLYFIMYTLYWGRCDGSRLSPPTYCNRLLFGWCQALYVYFILSSGGARLFLALATTMIPASTMTLGTSHYRDTFGGRGVYTVVPLP